MAGYPPYPTSPYSNNVEYTTTTTTHTGTTNPDINIGIGPMGGSGMIGKAIWPVYEDKFDIPKDYKFSMELHEKVKSILDLV